MFSYFKQRKLKKLIINLNKAYSELVKDKTEYQATTKDHLTLQEAVLSKFDLKITQTVVYYEELTSQYPDFDRINTAEDLWKLDKPEQAEGTLFFATDNQACRQAIPVPKSFRRSSHEKHIDSIHKSDAVVFLKIAATAHQESRYKSECISRCLEIHTTDPEALSELILSCKQNKLVNAPWGIFDETCKEVTIKTHTNLIRFSGGPVGYH